MPSVEVSQWLSSGKKALIGQKQLMPVQGTIKGKPLSSQKGQAEVFFLVDKNGQSWILKKFHAHCELDPEYLRKVASLLPRKSAFKCGTDREVLGHGALINDQSFYFAEDLNWWLDGTILMPRVVGDDWAACADDLREGETDLDDQQRRVLCRNLCRVVRSMEEHQCAHRDLSCGNVFVDLDTGAVSLIDFDSSYHPTLPMPDQTTCGTCGYAAPYAWCDGKPEPRQTWCEGADRFSLALHIAEFLTVTQGGQETEEGGIFDQDELCRRSGPGITSVIDQLKGSYPQAAALLQRAISSRHFSDCPTPIEWEHLFSQAKAWQWEGPVIDDLPIVSARDIEGMLKRCRPAAPIWPAPRLQDMPTVTLRIPKPPSAPACAIDLPADPWTKESEYNGIQSER